jgi:hypothetical protein
MSRERWKLVEKEGGWKEKREPLRKKMGRV